MPHHTRFFEGILMWAVIIWTWPIISRTLFLSQCSSISFHLFPFTGIVTDFCDSTFIPIHSHSFNSVTDPFNKVLTLASDFSALYINVARHFHGSPNYYSNIHRVKLLWMTHDRSRGQDIRELLCESTTSFFSLAYCFTRFLISFTQLRTITIYWFHHS